MIKLLSKKITGFFINGHERTLLAKKNIVISLAVKGLTIVIGLVLVPITISYINPTQYGIWLTLSSLISWFIFLDIGLANGLKNKLAEANALEKTESSRIYISTTYAILTIVSLALFILFCLSNFLLDWGKILNTQTSGNNLNLIALIILGSFCVQFILQTFSSVLTAFHAISKISVIYGIGQLGCLIGVLLLKKFTGGSLLYLVLVFTGIPIIVQFTATIWYFKTKYALFAPSFKMIDFTHAKDLLTTGGMFFFVQIGSLLLFQTDNMVVTQLFGPSQVTTFNLVYRLFSVITMVFTIIMNPFWPAFTDAYAKDDILWIKSIFKKMYKYFILLILISFMLLFASPLIFKLWVGDKIKIPFELSFVMVLYVIGMSWMTIHCFLVNGIGKIKLQMYLYIISTVINIPLAILLGKWIGISGVTISNVVVFIMMGIVLYIQCNKILNKSASGIWNA